VYVHPTNIKLMEPSSYNYQNLLMPPMTITHPAGCFSQFIRFFGPSIFVLWKLVMLRKRVLFFSPPPIGVVCYRVYCACCLGKITANVDNLISNASSIFSNIEKVKPIFYVNVADIEFISQQKTYIACTTERVFEDKKDLYDVYVDNQCVTSANQNVNSSLMKVNKSDIEKYNNLVNFKNELNFQYLNESNGNIPSEESFYQAYFTQQNNEIIQTLSDISMSQNREITSNHMKAMGLDANHDRNFVMDLLELYGIDALLVAENQCCPY